MSDLARDVAADLLQADSDHAPSSIAEDHTHALNEMAPLIRGHADGFAPLIKPERDQVLVVRATDDDPLDS